MTTVAIMSPGAMGSALGRGYAAGGARVIASVAGRSRRTRALAHGIELVDSPEAAIAAADIVLSIVPPDQAVAVATRIGAAAAAAGVAPLVADLNATAPRTVGALVDALGGLDLVDGSISGPPPEPVAGSQRPSTRLYLSGPRAEEIARLSHARLEVHRLGGPLGAASAVKMSTASVYKGVAAVFLQATVAAAEAGVLAPVVADLADAFPDLVADLGPWLALSASKAHRYVGEMREIATTQADVGLGPELFEAMATVWARVAALPAGRVSPEQAAADTDVATVARALSATRAGRDG